jgi:voltage-gated potassium channel
MADNQQEKLNTFQILIILLSVYVLAALFLDTVLVLPTETSNLLTLVDNGICVIFLLEFAIRFRKAQNKLQFMKWGWIDLISSIPTVDALRVGRLFRLIRLIRILRAVRSTKLLMSFVFANRKKGTFSAVAIISLLLIIFSSIAILNFENNPDSNIKTAEDALWWSFVTITTVGYGDRFPITTEGRLIAAILMIGGVGLFGTFTGFVASWFMEEKK